MFSQILPKLLLHKDIREISDDHNAGAFNAFKHCGKKVGILCLVSDMLKGFLPVFIASFFVNTRSLLFILVIIAPVLGSALGIFNRLRGGKSIAASGGVVIGLIPVIWIPFVLLAGLFVLLSTLIKIRPNRIKSIVVFLLFGVSSLALCIAFDYTAVAFGCLIIAIIGIIKHLNLSESIKKRLKNDAE